MFHITLGHLVRWFKRNAQSLSESLTHCIWPRTSNSSVKGHLFLCDILAPWSFRSESTVRHSYLLSTRWRQPDLTLLSRLLSPPLHHYLLIPSLFPHFSNFTPFFSSTLVSYSLDLPVGTFIKVPDWRVCLGKDMISQYSWTVTLPHLWKERHGSQSVSTRHREWNPLWVPGSLPLRLMDSCRKETRTSVSDSVPKKKEIIKYFTEENRYLCISKIWTVPGISTISGLGLHPGFSFIVTPLVPVST